MIADDQILVISDRDYIAARIFLLDILQVHNSREARLRSRPGYFDFSVVKGSAKDLSGSTVLNSERCLEVRYIDF